MNESYKLLKWECYVQFVEKHLEMALVMKQFEICQVWSRKVLKNGFGHVERIDEKQAPEKTKYFVVKEIKKAD